MIKNTIKKTIVSLQLLSTKIIQKISKLEKIIIKLISQYLLNISITIKNLLKN